MKTNKKVTISNLRIKGWRDDGIVIGSDETPHEILKKLGMYVGSSSIGTPIELIATIPEKIKTITESDFDTAARIGLGAALKYEDVIQVIKKELFGE